jgi:hypothetical protein
MVRRSGELLQWELVAEADRSRRCSRKPDPTERVVRARGGLPSAGFVGVGSAASALAHAPTAQMEVDQDPRTRGSHYVILPRARMPIFFLSDVCGLNANFLLQ